MKTSDVCIFKLNITLAGKWKVLRASDLLSWAWSTAPLSFQGPSAPQGQGPPPGLATALFRELSYLLIPMPSLCASNIFYDMINCSHTNVSTFCKSLLPHWFFCVYIVPFLPVWVLPSFHDLYSYPAFSLKPSLIIQARVFFFLRTPRAAWLSGFL